MRTLLISAFAITVAFGAYAQQPGTYAQPGSYSQQPGTYAQQPAARSGGGLTCSGLGAQCEAACSGGSYSQHGLCNHNCQERVSQCMSTGTYIRADRRPINNVARQ